MGDDLSILRNSSNPGRQVRRVFQLFVHPKYSLKTLENDIAVIRVSLVFKKKPMPVHYNKDLTQKKPV